MKKKEPRKILRVPIYKVDSLKTPAYKGFAYLCPTCLRDVENKDQICRWCNENLKENKDE